MKTLIAVILSIILLSPTVISRAQSTIEVCEYTGSVTINANTDLLSLWVGLGFFPGTYYSDGSVITGQSTGTTFTDDAVLGIAPGETVTDDTSIFASAPPAFELFVAFLPGCCPLIGGIIGVDYTVVTPLSVVQGSCVDVPLDSDTAGTTVIENVPDDGRLGGVFSSSVAVYPADGGIDIYRINSSSNGEFLLRLNEADMPELTGQTVLVDSLDEYETTVHMLSDGRIYVRFFLRNDEFSNERIYQIVILDALNAGAGLTVYEERCDPVTVTCQW